MGVCSPKGSRGRAESPLVASTEAKPSATAKIKKHGAAPEGVKGASGKPPCRLRRGETLCNSKNQETWRCARRGQGGQSQTSFVFIAPLSPPQRRNPLLAEESRYGWKSSIVVAPIWRDNIALRERAAWGAPAGAQSYWQGRFAACALLAVPFE